jgi:hypothetical protein
MGILYALSRARITQVLLRTGRYAAELGRGVVNDVVSPALVSVVCKVLV